MQLARAIDLYLVQLQADGHASSTLEQAEQQLRRMAEALGREREVGTIRPEDLAIYLAAPAARRRPDGKEKRASSMNVLRSKMRSFFRYLYDAGHVERDPARLIRRARCGAAPPRALPSADCRRLLGTLAKRKDPRGRRDHALFSLLVGAGLRIGSAVALRIEDLDLDEGVAWLRKTKGDRPAEVLLAPGVVRTLRAYLRKRRSGPVFQSSPGKSIDVRQARRRLAQALVSAGIERRATPHTLRHSFATSLLARTGDLRLVQRALGHASIGSTTIYADCSNDRLRTALAR